MYSIMDASLAHILKRHAVWRGRVVGYLSPTVSTTYPGLDRALPGGGWPIGALTEILCGHEGIGELGLVLPALAALSWAGKRVVWLAPPHLPYAPALAAAGVVLANLVVMRTPGRRDALWAAEQVLRSGSCQALLAWLRRPSRHLRRRPHLRTRRRTAGARPRRAGVSSWNPLSCSSACSLGGVLARSAPSPAFYPARRRPYSDPPDSGQRS